MQINITLDGSEGAHELNALAALIASLGGRCASAPAALIATVSAHDVTMPEVLAVDHSDEDAEIIDAAVAAGAPKHDSAGIPWDERIHSSSRATTADGTWRRRKNTPDATYDAVMAELSGAADPTLEPSHDDTPLPPSGPAVTAPAADAATNADDDTPPPPPTQDAGPDLSTFAKFVQAVMDKPGVPDTAKTYAALGTLCSESFGVAALKDMKDKPGSWALFYDMIG